MLKSILRGLSYSKRVNCVITIRNSSVSSSKELAMHGTSETDSNSLQQTTLERRFIYPEFLPDPKMEWRNPIREKLERMDMLKRRSRIDIPEFYVGNIMSVTSSNSHSSSKTNTFVGICIQRRGCGLRANFVLRNVVDNLGTEICYQMYDPTIVKIEVLRLEKRLDNELLYLRDALPEYSTFPFEMEPEILPEGVPVPVNPIKVILKPRPWVGRWERGNFQGIDQEHMMSLISDKMKWQIPQHEKPWEKYDLMKQYRSTIPEEEQKEIFAEVYSELHQLEITRKKMKRKRSFVKPKKMV
ncbi:large ribosomal subunit protein bL19m-like isoform X2 [Rhodnius prolixus]